MMKYAVLDAIDPVDWVVRNLPAESHVGYNPALFQLGNHQRIAIANL